MKKETISIGDKVYHSSHGLGVVHVSEFLNTDEDSIFIDFENELVEDEWGTFVLEVSLNQIKKIDVNG